MTEPPDRNTIIKEVSKEDYPNFIKSSKIIKTLEGKSRVLALGSFYENELSQMIVFCSTVDSLIKSKYTTELFHIKTNHIHQLPNDLKSLLDYYIKKHHITDIVVNMENMKFYKAALTNYGFQKTSNKNLYEWINPDYTFYTYRITATDSNKYYFGVRHVKKANASIDDCLNDGYFGSGGINNENNKFVNWKKKHKKNIKKEVLKRFDRKYKAYHEEKILINDLWKIDKLCLNSRDGGNDVSTIYNGNNKFSMMLCLTHGMTKHKGDSCCKCVSLSGVDFKNCDAHGLTKHRGSTCYKCLNLNLIEEDLCEKHGKTKFKSGLCSKCANEKNTKTKKCSIHGKTIFLGNTCLKCANNNSISDKFCEKHGLTKHRGDSCTRCNVEELYKPGECEVHGSATFIKTKCVSCLNESHIRIKECSVHGLVKHYGNNCYTCLANKNVSFKICEIHGETKFIGDKCFSCRQFHLEKKICKIHGKSFHTKNGCLKCVREESNYKKKICIMCQEEFTPLNGRQKVCKKDHYIPCPNCGTEMLYHSKKKTCKTCSISCGLMYRARLNREASSKIS